MLLSPTPLFPERDASILQRYESFLVRYSACYWKGRDLKRQGRQTPRNFGLVLNGISTPMMFRIGLHFASFLAGEKNLASLFKMSIFIIFSELHS